VSELCYDAQKLMFVLLSVFIPGRQVSWQRCV